MARKLSAHLARYVSHRADQRNRQRRTRMIARCSNEQMSLPRPIGDPKVVPGGIEDPEVRQAPGTILEILFEWPFCRHDTIALSGDVVNLKNQLHSSRRQPCLMGIRNCSSGAPTRTVPRFIAT